MAKRAILIGGGIGGLAAAHALKRVGWTPRVFEQAPELAEVGAGLSLWSNAVNALKRIGLADEAIAAGSVIETGRAVDQTGKTLSETDLRPLAEAAGAPTIMIHRAALQQLLAERLPPETLTLGARCMAVEQDGDGVTARFEDGRTERADILVGCDGIHSVVRESLWGKEPPLYSGSTAWRGIVSSETEFVPPHTTLLALGHGAQIGVFPCGGDRYYWFAGKAASRDEPPGPDGHHGDVLALGRRFSTPVPELIGATPPEALLRNDLLMRSPLGRRLNLRTLRELLVCDLPELDEI